MLSTFVIGLREGLEAALIVGIVAAFLKQRGRTDLLRLVWVGVGLAALICLGVGLGLHAYSADLPQKQQEGLETVVGVIAVAMVTYMVIWMRRHSRELKKQLEGAADSALQSGSGVALVAMAFLAVFREGFETAVFLLAAFNETANPITAGAGAVLGLVVAVGLGYGIYRGGVRINLSKFFRFTGGVLALVAAGLVVNALHTAHEAGWLNAGQGSTFDLSWLVRPGSVQSSLLTGMLGWQPRPVVIELAGWLLYLVPVGLYVVWPPGRKVSRRFVARAAGAVAITGVAAGIVLTAVRPAASTPDATTTVPVAGTGVTPANAMVQVRVDGHGVSTGRDNLVVTTSGAVAPMTWTLLRSATTDLAQRPATSYTVANVSMPDPASMPATASLTQLAPMAGGRLPLGVNAGDVTGAVPVQYDTTGSLTVSLDAATGWVLDVAFARSTLVSATLATGVTPIASVEAVKLVATKTAVAALAASAGRADGQADRRASLANLAALALVIAGLSVLVLGLSMIRRRPGAADAASTNAVPARPHEAARALI